jgi:DNA modification methylase
MRSKARPVRARRPVADHSALNSPKRGRIERSGIHAWLPYYAGFSEAFVASVIDALGISTESVLLDPMNGSGTTTMAAQRLGLASVGVEMNPAMAAIARAKNAAIAHRSDIDEILSAIVKRASTVPTRTTASGEMLSWLSSETYAQLRALESAVSDFHPADELRLDKRLQTVVQRSEVASLQRSAVKDFMTAALLLTLRKLANVEQSKNPTWIKPARNGTAESSAARHEFLATARQMITDLRSAFADIPSKQSVAVIEGDARHLPIRRSSIDLIVTSPPYLTRIDYAVTTAPEVAFLGYAKAEDFHRLRRTIMGSTCISGGSYETSPEWGETCNVLLKRIKRHPSKASSGYYFKTFVQYLVNLRMIRLRKGTGFKFLSQRRGPPR